MKVLKIVKRVLLSMAYGFLGLFLFLGILIIMDMIKDKLPMEYNIEWLVLLITLPVMYILWFILGICILMIVELILYGEESPTILFWSDVFNMEL